MGGVLNIAFPKSQTRRGRVIEQGKISPTLDTGCQIGVIMKNNKALNPMPDGSSRTIKEQYQKNSSANFIRGDGFGATGVELFDGEGEEIRIRKLTPKECFRLQGFPDEYFERARKVNSDSQLYKQAGNSVTVNVIEAIAKRLKL